MLCLNIEEEKHYLRQRKRGNAVMSEERKVLHQRIVVNLVVTLAALLAVFFLGPKLFRFFTNHHSVDHCNDYKSVG